MAHAILKVMKPLRARWGRLYSLLILTSVLVVVLCWALFGSAAGASPETTVSIEGSLQSSFTVSGGGLGDFTAGPPVITSPSAILVNMTTGRVLYEKEADTQRPMASTTKIMTCMLILEQMDLDAKVTVSAEAAGTSETVPWLREGDVLTVDELLHALMVRSSNPASVALAEACSGSLEAFVESMNAKAEELGLSDTHFVHPSGLDRSGHLSTAGDMANLACYAMQNEKFRELVSTQKYTIRLPGRDPVVCENTNKLLGDVEWVTGVKTGLTPKAEQCLVGSGTKDGVNVVSVILGQPSSKVCWAESKALLEYGFSQYRYVGLLEEGAAVAEALVPYRLDGRLQLVTAGRVGIELRKDESVTTTVEVDRPLTLPVAKGDVFGRVTLTVDDVVVDEVDLLANRSYDEVSLGSKVAYLWQRLGRVLGRVF